MPSILHGVNPIIDRALQLGGNCRGTTLPHYKHLWDCRFISKAPARDFDGHELVKAVYDQIDSNWRGRTYRNGASLENWRFAKQPKIGKDNKSLEVKLERAIVNVPKEMWPDADNWANQVPTASGLVGDKADKRRAIDLVHRCENEKGWYEFIELKVKSDTPLYAAMEVLSYGVLYIFSRTNLYALGYNGKNELLAAKGIHLRVLAPCVYYMGCKLDWLEKEVNSGLKKFLAERMSGFKMDFKFKAFPRSFRVEPFPNVYP